MNPCRLGKEQSRTLLKKVHVDQDGMVVKNMPLIQQPHQQNSEGDVFHSTRSLD